MEIDKIDLEDEETSQMLLKYLSGEIPFHEWLFLQSGSGCSSVVNDEGISENAECNTQDTTNLQTVADEMLVSNKVTTEIPECSKELVDLSEDEDGTINPLSDMLDPAIAKFPKRMTELFLMGKKPTTVKSVDEFMDELPLAKKKKKKRMGRKPLGELSDEHRSIMGEVNLCFIRKDFDKAWSLCEDLVKKAPRCPEPFQTLAFICEEKNDPEKAHQYRLIAAHLGAADCEEWIELGQTSLKKENWDEALVCFNEASKQKPSDVDILMAKAVIYDHLNQPKKKMEVFENILKVMPDDEGAKYLTVAKDVAQLYHELKQDEKAINALNMAFKKYPHEIKYEDVNILTELYMSLRKFQKAFQVISQYCNIEFADSESPSSLAKAAESLTEQELMEEKLTDVPFDIPDQIPIDLRAKLAVCLIQSYANAEQIQDAISQLFLEPVEEVGDLYLDVAEAYCETGQYEEALVLLDPLVETEKFGQAAVWLKKAECLETLGREEEAAEAYSQVVSLAPSHTEARFTLSALYQQLGRPEKALQVLEEMSRNEEKNEGDDDDDVEMENDDESISSSVASERRVKQISHQELKILYRRSLLLYSQKKFEAFLDNGIRALSHYLSDVYYDDDMNSVRINRSFRMAIMRMRKVVDEVPESTKGGVVADIRREEWWELLVKVAKTLCKVGRLSEMEYIIKCAMSSVRFSYCRNYQRELDFLGITACYLNGSLATAFNIIRVVINRNRNCKHLWNIFTRLVVGSGDSKHQKFCIRQLLKEPDSFPLQMINGHNALVSGNYKYALGEYTRAFRQKPMEPMISLLIGLSYLQLACQKYANRRNASIVHSFLFLHQYENLRGRCQETDYNLGRAYHQLSLLHFAVHYYHKALEYPFIGDQQDEEFWEKNHLYREAAFNLSLIYRGSGNSFIARQLLLKYCTM